MLRKMVLLLVFTALLAIPVVSAAKADQSNDTYEEADTSIDAQFLANSNIMLHKPKERAVTSEKDAIQSASTYFPLSSMAKSIKVEYQLITAPIQSFSESAIRKNDKLKVNGLRDTPVYIVTFTGVSFPAAGGNVAGSDAERVIFTENNVVVDATSGEVLFSFSH
ncbi:hypothetical protein PCCS19_03580 [Paenibacillus sp. CCS19]|uniref:hypothetical protein n=1 Tax=Paenibacillus sp. CCS19 TaxID=3158387 RepID=UPI00256CCADA|nr:hypothetical protein [Paenibacillus cellulosilyticus]GMK37305.1 hypothetical protein PCCS19_03580 [Paenibacillus cellulosilyticus]